MSEPEKNGATPGILATAADVRAFVLAGNATVTLRSLKTGARFTYRVREVPADPGRTPGPVSHFVHVLTEPDNERGYTYLGNVYTRNGASTTFGHGRKSRIEAGAPSARAFRWFFGQVVTEGGAPEAASLEVWHEGRCGRCGRKLTVPESIARGIGPECAGKAAA
jgi:hypothetical protein